MFHKELATMISAVVERHTSIPVLMGVLIDPAKKTITMTDMDSFAIIHNAPVTGKGKFVANAWAVRDIAKNTKKSFAMAITEKGMSIESDGDTYTLEAHDIADNFPELLQRDIESTVKNLPLDIFKVGFASSTEETRYYLKGVHLNQNGKEFNAVATDGHRLAVRTLELDVTGDGFKKEHNVIVPTKAVIAIQKLFSDTIALSLTKYQQFLIKQGDITYISKLVDGNYPDYQRVIPDETKATSSIIINGKELARLCSKQKIVDGRHIHMFGGSDGYWVRLKGEKSTIEKKLSEEKVNKFDIGYNASYMEDIIDDMEKKEFTMRLIDSSSPIRIENGRNLYVLMPVRM